MKRIIPILSGLSLALAPELALAHPGHGSSGFAAGLVHPLTGADHLAAMLLVGVAAALFVRRGGWTLPLAFLAGATLGFATFAAVPGMLVEAGIAASLIALGLVIALRLTGPAPLAAVAVAAFGYAHGAAHGMEIPQGAVSWLFAAGFLASSAILHMGGTALARILSPSALRWLGAGSAGLGLVMAGMA